MIRYFFLNCLAKIDRYILTKKCLFYRTMKTEQTRLSRQIMYILYRFITCLAMFVQNFVIKWIYKPFRNWWSPSPYSVPVTSAEFYALLEANDVEGVKQALGAGRNPNALVPDPRHPKGNTTQRKLPPNHSRYSWKERYD